MTDDELTARLALSRKQMLQRKNKPMAKHANEVFGVGVSESRESMQTGQRALAHVKSDNSDADSVCREETPTPKAIIEDERNPLPVDEMAGALQDRIHRDSGSCRAANTRRMTDDQREAYEERAGILEYEAGMTRADAEKMAALAVGFEIVNHVKRRRLERAARLGIIADDEEAEFTMGAGD